MVSTQRSFFYNRIAEIKSTKYRPWFFSSHIFNLLFSPFALLVYYALFRTRQRWRNAWLIVAGYTFYGWAEQGSWC